MARADRDDLARGLMTGDDAPVCRAANTHVTLVATVDVPNVAPADARGLYLDQNFTLSGLGDVMVLVSVVPLPGNTIPRIVVFFIIRRPLSCC